MDPKILERLRRITDEEKQILAGRDTVDWDLYRQSGEHAVTAKKLLAAGKQITIRPHTRFVHFPAHTHDYVEAVYMCEGTTTHIINGKKILLEPGELLFLNQGSSHEVCRAGEGDVAVNFIMLPDFLATALTALGEGQTPLRRFLVDCLCGRNTEPGYLHFQVAEIKPIQNLIENLLRIIMEETPMKRKISQMTMALLLLQIVGHTERLAAQDREQAAIWHVLNYVETNYATGSLAQAAELLHYDMCWLSREIKRKTGKNYTQLVQEKRLAQAAFLLKNTDSNVVDISVAVGYENTSYFHRLFTAAYGKTPKEYRYET